MSREKSSSQGEHELKFSVLHGSKSQFLCYNTPLHARAKVGNVVAYQKSLNVIK